MNYIKEYKKFINGYNFNDALRVTVGVTLPAIVLGQFKMLPIGLLASIGALTVNTADLPGPMQRRFNGMFATLILMFFIATLVGLCHTQPLLLGILIALLCFLLTMLGIYGNRVNAIGFAGLIIMVLSLDSRVSGWHILLKSLYVVAGGAWYMLLSLALFRMMPYRIIQQALGDSIISIGDYLKTRSRFYDAGVDYDKTYKSLMLQQEALHEKQELLREMLFKSRTIIRQSTTVSRTLLVIFLESIDIFEKATATLYNYQAMHRHFDDAHILPQLKAMILRMVAALHQIGLAVQSGHPSPDPKDLNNALSNLKEEFETFINTHRQPQNIEPLLHMRKIMHAIEDMVLRIYTLHHYTHYNRQKIKEYELSDNYDSFVNTTRIEWSLFKENLTFRSTYFKHALRVSIATTVGYAAALLLHLEYSYWVLLTILVILKPSYSLTKQRNYHRLIGTVIGALLGIALLFLVPHETWRVVVMIVLILASYSFIRTNYFIGVLFMTAYILIFFYLIDRGSFVSVFENRVIDTLIGSIIAFIATYVMVPSWEKEQIKMHMEEALEKSVSYFNIVATSFISGKMDTLNYRLMRKGAFVTQTELSGAFNRMMNEPKSKQHNARELHQFTVMIYTLNSHIASLSDFAQKLSSKYYSKNFEPITQDIAATLNEAKMLLTKDNTLPTAGYQSNTHLKQKMEELVDKRRHELQQGLMDTETKTTLIELKPIVDQFLFISRIAGDIKKRTSDFYSAPNH